jgi:hypothetical protein
MINLVSPRGHRQILLATFSRPKSTFLQLMSAFHATRGRNLGLRAVLGDRLSASSIAGAVLLAAAVIEPSGSTGG